MKQLVVESKIENVDLVLEFVNSFLDEMNVLPKIKNQLGIAIDEIYSNVAYYAYKNNTSPITIEIDMLNDTFIMRFIDSGIPFNPLEKEDPDINLDIEERKAGGLGIYIVKQMMDSMEYAYLNKQNILTIKKNIK